MPAKNSLKVYVEDGYYHIYNRGVNRADIFKDKQDRSVFLKYLSEYLLKRDNKKLAELISKERDKNKKHALLTRMRIKNFHDKIVLIAYCLMPNHFHILAQQRDKTQLELFMRSFMTRYTKYFNTRYARVGPVFQGRYKAVLVNNRDQLVHLSRYIHRNPLDMIDDTRTVFERAMFYCQPSSYPVYLGEIQQAWVQPEVVLSEGFTKSGYGSYREFVEFESEYSLSRTMILEA